MGYGDGNADTTINGFGTNGERLVTAYFRRSFVVADDPSKKDFRVRDVVPPAGLADNRFLSRRDLRGVVDRLARIPDEASEIRRLKLSRGE